MLADGCVVILNEMFVCVAPTNGMQRKHVFDRPCLSMKPLFLAFIMFWAGALSALAAL